MKKSSRFGCIGVIVLNLSVWAVLAWLLCACSPTKYVPVVKTEYRDRDVERTVTDTVHDTRIVWLKGDTVLDIRDRWRHSTEYVHDTCFMVRTDSIPAPYPVERELSRWERTKIDYGGFAIAGMGAAICFAVVCLARKFRK